MYRNDMDDTSDDSDGTGSTGSFKLLTGKELKQFLRSQSKSFTFMKYIHRLANKIKSLYPIQKTVNFKPDFKYYETFLLELQEFLRELGCPHKEFISGNIKEGLQRKGRERLLAYLNSKVLNTEEDGNNTLKNKFKGTSYKVSKESRESNLIKSMPEINGDQAKDAKPLPQDKYVVKADEIIVKLDNVLEWLNKPHGSEEKQHEPDSKETPPNYKTNVRPGDGQPSPTPQVTSAEVKTTSENTRGELTIDCHEPSQSVMPTPQQNFLLQIDRNARVAQYANSNNKHFQQGSNMQGSEYRNLKNFDNMQYNLNNQQQGPPAYGQNQNSNFPRPQEIFNSQGVRPKQEGRINPMNQNSQGVLNAQIQHKDSMTQLIHRNENNFEQSGMVQGTFRNRGLDDNIQQNVMAQWQSNRPAACNPPNHQNLDISKHQGIAQGFWNTHVSGNIPKYQNIQHGWNNQGPHNNAMPQFGNNYNFQQGSRIQGGEYQIQGKSGNLQYNFYTQQGYRPPTYGYQNMNIPQPQGMYISHGIGATYYVTNIHIHHNHEGMISHAVHNNGMGTFDNNFHRDSIMPQREYQNRSSSGLNNLTHFPQQQEKTNNKIQNDLKNQAKPETKPRKF